MKLKKREKTGQGVRGQMMIYYLMVFIVGYALSYIIHRKTSPLKNQEFVRVTKLSVNEDMDSYFEDIMIPTVD